MYKLEMHLHTKGNSSCARETPQNIIERYKQAGYNGIVCTNHFNNYIYYKYFNKYSTKEEKIQAYLKSFYELRNLGEKNGIDVFFGLELALKNDDYHNYTRLHCTELLIYGIAIEEFIEYNIKLAEMDYEEFFKFADSKNWLIIQAHPYRARTKRINPNFLHGIEVYNGHPFHRNRNKLSYIRAVKNNLIQTAGSDFHALGYEGTGMYFERKVENEKDLVKLLKETKTKIFKRKKHSKQ